MQAIMSGSSGFGCWKMLMQVAELRLANGRFPKGEERNDGLADSCHSLE
jgi:hypothetical protein